VPSGYAGGGLDDERHGPLVLIGALVLAGCHHAVVKAVELAFDAAETWPYRIAVLAGALIVIALVKRAYEKSQKSPWEEIDEQDKDDNRY
jgi:hypothetical protein